MSKIQMIVVGLLSATALAGAFNVPSASAADVGYGQNKLYAQNRGDRDRDRGNSRECRNLRRRIEVAEHQRHPDRRLIARLEREYRRECGRR